MTKPRFKSPPTVRPSHNRAPAYLKPGFLIFTLAFVIRILFLLQRQHSPFFAAPEIDQQVHDLWAQKIAAGDFWGQEAFFRAPLYYYLLALCYYVFGHNYIIPRLLQFLLGSVTAAVMYLLGRRMHSEKVGILAGVLYALCGPMIYHEGELLVEAILLPLLVLLLWQLERVRTQPTGAGLFLGGVILGFGAIARPNILLFIPLVWLWSYWILRRSWRGILIFTAGLLLIILPITLRNYILSRDFVLIASPSGINFFIGNNPYSDGYTAQVPGFPADWIGVEGSIKYAEIELGRKLKPSEVSHYWTQRAIREMSSRPGQWLTLMLRKIRLCFSGIEIGNNEDIYYDRRWSLVFAALMWNWGIAFPFGLLLPLGILGIWLTFSWRRDALLIFYFISYAISIVIYFVCSRYRLPLYPPLMIWASAGIFELIRLIKSKGLRRHLLPLSITAIVMIGVNLNPLAGRGIPNFEGAYYLGNKFLSLKDYPRALQTFQEALALDSSSALARHGGGVALLNLGRKTEAKREFLRAVELDPGFVPARNNLGMMLQEEGDLAGAAQQFRAAAAQDSNNVFAQRGLADIAAAQQDWTIAEKHYRRAYDLGAAESQVISRWAQALLLQQKYAQALQVNAKLLALEPNNARAHHNQARIYLACDSLAQAAHELEIVLQLAPDTKEAQDQLDEIRKINLTQSRKDAKK